jgi:hypothetical protein
MNTNTGIMELNDFEIDFVSGSGVVGDVVQIGTAIAGVGAFTANPFLVGLGAGIVIGASGASLAIQFFADADAASAG